MSIGVRRFLLFEDGSFRPVSARVLEEIIHGSLFPEFAGQKVTYVIAFLELLDGKPSVLEHVEGGVMQFDERGSAEKSWEEKLREAARSLEGGTPTDGKVVDISSKLASRRHRETHHWVPGPVVVRQISQAIWPKQYPQEASKAEPVKGGKRTPPLSYAGQKAIQKCSSALSDISWALGELEDAQLRAVAAEALERGRDNDVMREAVWYGISRAAERELERRRAWKSPSGKWFAAVYTMEWTKGRQSGRGGMVEHVECDGRAQAVKAARELLAKHVNQVDHRTTVEADICPEIDWSGHGLRS